MTTTENNAQFEKLKISIDDLDIKVKIIENQSLKAIVGINFGDFIIKGFRVQPSKYPNDKNNLWITPPSYKDGSGKYHPIFYAPNENLWAEIESKIISEYEKESKKHFAKRLNENLDDMQF